MPMYVPNTRDSVIRLWNDKYKQKGKAAFDKAKASNRLLVQECIENVPTWFAFKVASICRKTQV